eukprot:6471233-Amphidinium_carterae.4
MARGTWQQMSDDVMDSVSFAAEGIGRVGLRAKQWEGLFPGFTQVQAGLTHLNVAGRCVSALDRLYTTMDAAEVLATGLVLKCRAEERTGNKCSVTHHLSPSRLPPSQLRAYLGP